jgi:4-oxalocrotonate tautomerase
MKMSFKLIQPKKIRYLIFVYALLILYMPIVTVETYSGRTQTEKDRLAEAITDDIMRIWKVQKKDVIVVFREASHGNWYASGIRL